MTLQPTATRIWKQLPPADRLAAATSLLDETPQELAGLALGALVKARNLRPQAARKLPLDAQARILGSVLEPGEPLAQGLLVALHLSARRPLLSAFLDALSLPHEDGILAEAADDVPPPSAQAVCDAVGALSAFPPEQVRTYLNTLWLQDPERWSGIAEAADSLQIATAAKSE